ncbi:MAG TPA: lipid-A-disaccharide synthase [bacterium]|nr:lipid-A-disaccharide synthase [bacterium]
MKKIFIITGEQSGDMHASALIQDLLKYNEKLQISAIGGNYIKRFPVKIFKSIDEMAVIGLIEALKKIRFFKKLLVETLEYIKSEKFDIIIFVDYPGFNLTLAERIKKNNIQAKLVYYISPQIWAWHTSRIYKIDKLFDKILVIFDFEKKFYDKYLQDKNKTQFVGHPLMKRISSEYYYENLKNRKNYILFLPGSRENEIKKLLPELINTAILINQKYPNYKIIISAADIKKINLIKSYIPQNLKNYYIIAGAVYSLIQNAKIVIVASGTATLETGIIAAPMIVIYKVNFITGLLAQLLIKIKYISLINIVLEQNAVKEFIQNQMTAQNIFSEIVNILEDENYAAALHKEIKNCRKLLNANADTTAAAEIIKLLNRINSNNN